MCGILGLVKKNQKIKQGNFEKLNKAQIHRGPDAGGVWFGEDGRIALGHRRLSIIDLAQGVQPMLTPDKKKSITFNGEIYNFLELRKELQKKNYEFSSNSDTEVILSAYQEWGSDCVKKFRGMFAFAIVDLEKEEIFLARDPFGIKPLVYYQDRETFCFASEIRTLAKVKNLDLEIDYKAIDYYLWLQYIPDPITVFTKVQKLEAAHFMRVDFFGQIKEKKRYWLPEFRPQNDRSEEEWLNGLEEVLRDSVRAHIVADVPVGSFLSGGIDSTVISKYLAEEKDDLKTFSIGFEEEEYNELPLSLQAAKKVGSDHYTKVVTPDFFSIFNKLVEYHGEPFADSSAIPTYYVSKLAREQVTVVLSGDGGDELFGGYNSYQVWQERMSKKKSRPLLMNIARSLMSFLRPEQYVPERPTLKCWLNTIEYFNYYNRRYLWQKDFQKSLARTYRYFEEHEKAFVKNSLVNKAQLFDLTNYLPFDILKKVDTASMMNSLEARVPFLDKRVAEFALSMPESLNVKNDWKGKRLLKKTLQNDFSADFIYRQKKGFAVPLDKWFSEGGLLYAHPYNRLINSESEIFKNIFNLDAVYNFISSGDYSKTYFLLFLEEWFLQYENRKDLIEI